MSTHGRLDSKDEEFYHLLRKQHSYFKGVMDISKEENTKLEEESRSIREVKALIEKKKTLLSTIADLDKKIEPLKQHWKKQEDRSGPLAILIGQEIEDLNTLLKDILNLDNLSQKKLEKHLQLLKDRSN